MKLQFGGTNGHELKTSAPLRQVIPPQKQLGHIPVTRMAPSATKRQPSRGDLRAREARRIYRSHPGSCPKASTTNGVRA